MIWLIGKRGMLGSVVEDLLREKSIPYVATDTEVDITNYDALRDFALRNVPAWIINCSAYTAVDRAEDERDLAFAINADGVLHIAKTASEVGSRIVHISTDYVFDGEKDGAYDEFDATAPTGVYGLSKLEGERYLAATMNEYFILRTAWLYGIGGENFLLTMLRLFGERDEVRVVDDQWGSPTFTRDLASVIVTLVNGNCSRYGVYHVTNEGRTNWYEFAKAIYMLGRKYGLVRREVRIVPIPASEYPTRARRPKNSYLSTGRLLRDCGLVCRGWQEALEECIQTIAGTVARS